MRKLFELDLRDYAPDMPVYSRPSARALIIRDGRIAMMHSARDAYYKFPGGGIEPCETPEEALIRETGEEAGLCIIPSSVVPYGYVHRRERQGERIFDQMNLYYFCSVSEKTVPVHQDAYEKEEGFELFFVRPQDAVYENRTKDHGTQKRLMIERESRILDMLVREGYLPKENPE